MDEREKQSSGLYAEGSQARAHGSPRVANPYPSASPEFAEWDRGWQSADPPLKDLPPEKRAAVETPTG
jgi:hypothetical protein